ncbi:MAG: choice-of-anchor D domain-containing protein [Pseudomonadota bacterium]|nr:choice-of-anchor D domain-containing protein [Pseudomonadota bacterium]
MDTMPFSLHNRHRTPAHLLLTAAVLFAAIGSAIANGSVTQMAVTQIGTSVEELDFGMLPNGASSSPQILTLTNTSNVTLYEFSWRIDGTTCATFDVTPPLCLQEAASYKATGICPEDLGPGGSCTLAIVFQPVVTGALLARLNVAFTGSTPMAPSALLVGAGTPITPYTPGTILVVEYYSAGLNHYFLTVTPEEMTILDAGIISGWKRTGLFFWAYPADGSAPLGTQPVCRFYGRPEAGLDSHFYSVSVDECQAVARNWPLAWILESPDYFRAYLPRSDGACPNAPSQRVYRLYNNRPDANHRFTTSYDIQTFMQHSLDWTPEGYGLYSIAMCVPP